MGDFANNSDNIVEELLKVVPVSYFLTDDFKKKCAENGFSGRWSMCNTMVTFKGTNILIPPKERINLVLEKVCHELSENSNRALYNFISLVIKGYCDNENTKVDLSGLRMWRMSCHLLNPPPPVPPSVQTRIISWKHAHSYIGITTHGRKTADVCLCCSSSSPKNITILNPISNPKRSRTISTHSLTENYPMW